MSTTPLADTAAVAEFMDAFKQPIRTTPTTEIPDEERLLRVRLVIEEALEFAKAMGCEVFATTDGPLPPKGTRVEIAEGQGIDLIESADALGDIVVVTKGSAHSLGIPVDEVLVEAIHVSNMNKFGPNGEIIYIPGTTKVGKPAGWQPPTDAIRTILIDHGWQPDEAA